MKQLLPCLALSLAVLIVLPALATTYLVHPDGTGDFPTIQAAINAAANGDTVALADGVFTGDGNRDMDYMGETLTIRSQSGDPEFCIIDCQGSAEQPHRAFYLNLMVGAGAVLADVTITSGYQDRRGWNVVLGFLSCRPTSSPAHLCVYDPAGRLIRTLVDSRLPTGSHTITWDGRDQSGQIVAAGVYFY